MSCVLCLCLCLCARVRECVHGSGDDKSSPAKRSRSAAQQGEAPGRRQDLDEVGAEDEDALMCRALAGMPGRWRHGARGSGSSGGTSAVFGLVLDGAHVPVCDGGELMGVQWFRKKTPLLTSVAMDQVCLLLPADAPPPASRFAPEAAIGLPPASHTSRACLGSSRRRAQQPHVIGAARAHTQTHVRLA